MLFRRTRAPLVATVGLALLVAGCSTAPPPPPPPPAAAPTAAPTTVAPSASADPDVAVCRQYVSAARDARTPVDAMRTQTVLGPFIALIMLSTRRAATAGEQADDYEVVSAMREVIAAIDDLQAQAAAGVPPSADPTKTLVRLDPTRLVAALDEADRVCASVLSDS